jgi:23S rRNA (cytidine1920-2'-O)/16S rRNA (cytidine1409-2'-O)-methyltransferase
MPKLRADQLLVDRGLAESRAKAQALILAGLVFSGERKLDKAGHALAADAAIEVRGREHPWVSRGGIKLAHALDRFGWDVTGAIALDVGSSTGGFTDVLLQRGAARVFAVDVGTNQLAWKLRQDSRVIVHEQTNARYLTPDIVTEAVQIIVCDASFIGLAKVLATALDFAGPGGRLVALVKPQFEAERAEIGKGGVVRDPAVHDRVCAAARAWVESRGWTVIDLVESPITGPEGNREFLLGAQLRPRADHADREKDFPPDAERVDTV